MQTLPAAEVKVKFEKALALQKLNRNEEALNIYGEILSTNPNIPEVHFQTGRIFAEALQPQRALRHFRAALLLKPKEPAIWLGLAEAVALSADDEEQRKLLETLKRAQIPPAIKLRIQDRFSGVRRPAAIPANLQAEARKTSALMVAGNLAEAERAASALIARHGGVAAFFNVLGSAQAQMGKHEAAARNFAKAIALDPEYVEPRSNLGLMFIELGRDADAMSALRGAVTVAPLSPVLLQSLAGILVRRDQRRIALPLLRRAVRLSPNDLHGQFLLANVLVKIREYTEAEPLLRKLLSQDDGNSEAHRLLAVTMHELGGRDEAAVAEYDRALELKPDNATAIAGKASLFQTLGKFDAAQDLFLRAIAIEPENGDLYRQYTTSHKVEKGDPILDTMLAQFDNPKITNEERSDFAFAITKAYEDQKDYDRAFPFLKAANDLVRKDNPFDRSLRAREVRDLIAAFRDFDFHAAKLSGTTDFAPIFVTGMPRSGTTLVEQIISSHSAVEGAGEVGELNRRGLGLLSEDGKVAPHRPDDLDPAAIAAIGHDYAAMMRERFPGARHVTDKSIQTYLLIGLAKLAIPNARFIVVRRDPRDNLLSIYKNKFSDRTHLYAYDMEDLAHQYRTFVDMVDFWRTKVPDWFYEVQYEDLVANPEEETRKLIAACGLDWEDACLNFHENDRKVQTLSVFQVRQPMSKASVKSWERYAEGLAPMFEALGDLLPKD